MNIKSKVLKKGDTIGVVSPASPSYNKSDIVRGKKTLEEWGYKVVLSKHLNKKKGFFAGSDQERAEDLNEMFARTDIDAIFVTQGGYGSARILKYLNFELIRKNPKIFIGYSDITSLHLAIYKKTGLVTFYGPGVSRYNSENLTDYTKEYLFKALTSKDSIGNIPMANEKKWINSINSGIVKGEVIGGNLSLICSTLGTPYEIDTKGKILFFEELETEPWIIDHMLSHLYNAGKLQEASGIIIGECVDCVPRKLVPGYYVDTSLEDILDNYIKPLKIPALYGFPLGHTKDMATLPLGVKLKVDATNKKITVLESGVH